MADMIDPLKLSVADQIAVLGNLHQAAAAELLGIKPRTLRDRAATVPRQANGRYSGPDLAAWMVEMADKTATDPELAGGDSPALERYRAARAELAEFELKLKRGDLMARVDVHEGLSEAGAILRRKAVRLRKLFGDEAAQIIADAVDDMLKSNERLFGPKDEN